MNSAEHARNLRVRRLCLSLELDEFAGLIIVDLLERMEDMQRDLERMRAFLESRDADER